MCTSSVATHANNIISATTHFPSASIPPSNLSGTPFKAIRLLLRRKATQSMWHCLKTRASGPVSLGATNEQPPNGAARSKFDGNRSLTRATIGSEACPRKGTRGRSTNKYKPDSEALRLAASGRTLHSTDLCLNIAIEATVWLINIIAYKRSSVSIET